MTDTEIVDFIAENVSDVGRWSTDEDHACAGWYWVWSGEHEGKGKTFRDAVRNLSALLKENEK